MKNVDDKVVKAFGEEWDYYNQSSLKEEEAKDLFSRYFNIFPSNFLQDDKVGIDIGCGSGRWAKHIAPLVKELHCVDASYQALNVAKNNLDSFDNCIFTHATTDDLRSLDNKFDFGYSIGVLHHIPDTKKALIDCISILKKGAPFLIYLYYNFENRGLLFVTIWKISNYFRIFISRLPFFIKKKITDFIALTIYLPLKYMYIFFEFMKFNVSFMPLYFYKNKSFYTMRTDSLDRFGTIIEKRFSKKDISELLESAGFEKISFSTQEPYWTAICYKK